MVTASSRWANGLRKGTPWLFSTAGALPTPNPKMNRPPETSAIPAADMAVIKGVRENTGRMPVPTTIRCVAKATEANWVRESLPAPSVIQISP